MKTRPKFFFFSISNANLIITFRKKFLTPIIRLHKLKIQYGCLITKYLRETSTKKNRKSFQFFKRIQIFMSKTFSKIRYYKKFMNI